MNSISVKLILLQITIGNALAQRGQLRPIPDKRSSHDFKITTNEGNKILQMREVLLEGKSPNGKIALGSLLVLFDPETQYYVSHYGGTYPEAHRPSILNQRQLRDMRKNLVAMVHLTDFTTLHPLPQPAYQITPRPNRNSQ